MDIRVVSRRLDSITLMRRLNSSRFPEMRTERGRLSKLNWINVLCFAQIAIRKFIFSERMLASFCASVTQSGQSACLTSRKPQVQILPGAPKFSNATLAHSGEQTLDKRPGKVRIFHVAPMRDWQSWPMHSPLKRDDAGSIPASRTKVCERSSCGL